MQKDANIERSKENKIIASCITTKLISKMLDGMITFFRLLNISWIIVLVSLSTVPSFHFHKN